MSPDFCFRAGARHYRHVLWVVSELLISRSVSCAVLQRRKRLILLTASALGLLAFAVYGRREADRVSPWARVSAQMIAALGAEYLGYDVILLIGDSRAAELGQHDAGLPRTLVFNMGVSGSTVTQWRSFLETLRVRFPKGTITVIWLGVNDLIYDAAPAQVVARNLRHLASTLNGSGHRVFILDQVPLDSKAAPLDDRVNIGSRELNTLFEATPFTTATVIRISDMFKPDTSTNSAALLLDGIHLTSRGNQQVWCRIVTAIVPTTTGHCT
jgi:lysophospholipase L1-like esterase